MSLCVLHGVPKPLTVTLLCMFGGDDVSSLCVPPGLFDKVISHRPYQIWEYWLAQVFTLMCLDELSLREVT